MGLPNTPESKALYIELRDHRNRWRKMEMKACGGDADAFAAKLLEDLKHESWMASFREVFDFCCERGVLTPEQIEAGNSVIAWGEQLVGLIHD